MIISVSQMLGNIVGLNNARFQESLSLINSYATSDKVMKGTGKVTTGFQKCLYLFNVLYMMGSSIIIVPVYFKGSPLK